MNEKTDFKRLVSSEFLSEMNFLPTLPFKFIELKPFGIEEIFSLYLVLDSNIELNNCGDKYKASGSQGTYTLSDILFLFAGNRALYCSLIFVQRL